MKVVVDEKLITKVVLFSTSALKVLGFDLFFEFCLLSVPSISLLPCGHTDRDHAYRIFPSICRFESVRSLSSI